MMLVARRCEPPINWTLPCGDEPHLFEWTSAVTDDFCCRFPNRETTISPGGTEPDCVGLLESRQSVRQSADRCLKQPSARASGRYDDFTIKKSSQETYRCSSEPLRGGIDFSVCGGFSNCL